MVFEICFLCHVFLLEVLIQTSLYLIFIHQFMHSFIRLSSHLCINPSTHLVTKMFYSQLEVLDGVTREDAVDGTIEEL